MKTNILIALMVLLAGCAGTETRVKRQIGADLMKLAETTDCPTMCEAVKAYVQSQLVK